MPPESLSATKALEPAFVTILDGCDYLGLSQASVYRLIGLGRLEARKAGGRTLITFKSLKALAAELPPAKIKAPTTRRRMGA
jgi:hypothetical protein